MPIRPSQRARYPRDWHAITARIRERAGNACECAGECGAEHEGRCAAPNGVLVCRDDEAPAIWVPAFDGERVSGFSGPFRIVLTVAHLDHAPEHNDPSNLRALCQRCHLAYDKHEHAKNARETRRSRKAAGDLPGVA